MGCLRANTRAQVNTRMNTHSVQITCWNTTKQTRKYNKLQGLGPIKHRNEHSVYYTFSSVYNTKQQGMNDKQTNKNKNRQRILIRNMSKGENTKSRLGQPHFQILRPILLFIWPENMKVWLYKELGPREANCKCWAHLPSGRHPCPLYVLSKMLTPIPHKGGVIRIVPNWKRVGKRARW